MAFTSAQLTDIRRFCGYSAYAAYGYVLSGPEMATLDIQCAAMDVDEQSVVINAYLTNLYALESAIPAAGANLDTDRAAVWYHNKQEVADRQALFDDWRMRLCDFIGVVPGRGLRRGGSVIRT